MRRFLATFLDLAVIQVCFVVFTSFFTMSTSSAGGVLENISNFILYLVYNFIIDYFFEGLSIGKIVVGIKTIFSKNNKVLYSLTHGILRLVFYILFPVTGVYYIFINKGKVPYDVWFQTNTICSR